MALLKLGSLVTSVNGSVGGHYIQNSPNGFTLKTKRFKPLNYSFINYFVRTNYQKITRSWKLLSPAQRQQWRGYSFAGSTGFQAFCALNTYTLYNGNPLRTSPPVHLSLPYMAGNPIFSLNPSVRMDCSFSVNNFSSGWSLFVQFSSAFSNSRYPISPLVHQIFSRPLSASNTLFWTPTNPGSPYPFPKVNQHCYVRFIAYNSSTGYWFELWQGWAPS